MMRKELVNILQVFSPVKFDEVWDVTNAGSLNMVFQDIELLLTPATQRTGRGGSDEELAHKEAAPECGVVCPAVEATTHGCSRPQHI